MAYFSLKKILTSVFLVLILKSVYLHADDTELPKIKAQALNIYTTLKMSEDASFSDHHRVHIYVGNRADDFIIQAAKIQIDENAPIRYVYSEIESSVLLEGGAHEITTANLASGSHRIRAEIVALARGAGPNVDRIFPSIEQQVNVEDETHIEFELVSEGMKKMLGNADIVVRDWRLSL
ncbi:hypothetical protein [Zhongshania aquimaris]|uniref:DUF4397 domain-containing protein n=1 Tax=Zhongshania aquimaris TaxID=2857107 RepID=A0ABS6VVC9_9GAMM|nr:hypothetical protein [Zhongshania aquimaris]MBW2942294.1 hypothetical protein [Zhongshania aquimaris]